METKNFTSKEQRDDLNTRIMMGGYNNIQYIEEENVALRKQVLFYDYLIL